MAPFSVKFGIAKKMLFKRLTLPNRMLCQVILHMCNMMKLVTVMLCWKKAVLINEECVTLQEVI